MLYLSASCAAAFFPSALPFAVFCDILVGRVLPVTAADPFATPSGGLPSGRAYGDIYDIKSDTS